MLEGRSVIVRHFGDTKIAGLVARPEYLQATQRGLLTPDHVIYTGRRPLLGHDVAAFAASYSAQNAEFGFESATCSISSPRVLLDPSYGMLCVGRNARTAKITSDLATHMLSSIAISEQLGGYRPADAEHCCELEFWGAQQAKLAKPSLELEGRVALVTGAGSGIGKACAAELLSSGASVIGWDISPKVIDTFNSPEWLGQVVDVTDHEAQAEALQGLVDRFGGLDILVVSAGIFPQATHIKDLNQGDWRRTMAINVDAVADLYTLVYPYLALSYGGGRVVVIASKNVAAPGPGAAAYSSSKAALTQLSRVAALEWAEAGIRVNYLHPDAVFDTGLWTPELLAARAEHYGMTVDQYKRRNLLHTEVTSKAVAKLATAMATDLFACSTGAQVSIDGGNDRSI